MRRVGRQHGIVRSYRIIPPPLNPRLVKYSFNELFTKLPSKPTDRSKYNRTTTMGSGQVHWLRSNDIASSSYKLLTWRVVNGPGPVSNLPDISAAEILDCEDKEEENGGAETMKTEENGHNSDKEDGGSYDDSMSFYDVGMMMTTMDHVHVLNDDEEDGWCFV